MSLAAQLRVLAELIRQDRETNRHNARKRTFLFGCILSWVVLAVCLLSFAEVRVVGTFLVGFVILSAVGFVAGIVWLIYVLIQDNQAGRWLTEQPQHAKIYFTSTIVPAVLATQYTEVRAAGPGSTVELSRVLQTVDSYTVTTKLGEQARRFETKFDFQELEARVEDEWVVQDARRRHQLGEVSIRQIFESENTRRVKELGTWLVVSSEVDHEFAGETVILSQKLFPVSQRGLEKVILESPVFNQHYRVYSNNQREARVCLKTNVIAALTRLEEEYAQTFIEFKNRRVLIGVRTASRLFEFNLGEEYTEDSLKDSLEVVHALTALSEELNINHEYLYRS